MLQKTTTKTVFQAILSVIDKSDNLYLNCNIPKPFTQSQKKKTLKIGVLFQALFKPVL
jgi:hypothetical protein